MIILNISLFCILIFLIILMFVYTNKNESFLPDVEPINYVENRPSWQYQQYAELLSPFDYENYKNTDDYEKYFYKDPVMKSSIMENDDLKKELKKVKFGYTPDHLELIGSTTYQDEIDLN